METIQRIVTAARDMTAAARRAGAAALIGSGLMIGAAQAGPLTIGFDTTFNVDRNGEITAGDTITSGTRNVGGYWSNIGLDISRQKSDGQWRRVNLGSSSLLDTVLKQGDRNGGTLHFDLNHDKIGRLALGRLALIGDVIATLILDFEDGTSQVIQLDNSGGVYDAVYFMVDGGKAGGDTARFTFDDPTTRMTKFALHCDGKCFVGELNLSNSVSEPATFAGLGLGLALLGWLVYRRRRMTAY